MPIAIGLAAGWFQWAWWWGALAAIAVFLVAAIAPNPEEGESRVAAGDLAFLLVAALFVAGLVWLGAWAGRRWSARARA